MSAPVKYEDLSKDSVERLRALYKGDFDKLARYGEPGYLLPARYKPHADAVRAMSVRADDVWLLTFPRSGTALSFKDFHELARYEPGCLLPVCYKPHADAVRAMLVREDDSTHMTAEMLWLLQNNMDYKRASDISLSERNTFLEIFSLHGADAPIGYQLLATRPSPRLISTHLALSLLPPTLLDTTKVVFVARDPRDVAVSYFNFYKRLKNYGRFEEFKQFWELFIDDLIVFTPFFSLLKDAWAKRNHPNMLFLFYEDIVKDMPSAIRRVANFLGKEYSEEEVHKLCEHMDIENMRNNPSVQPKGAGAKVYVGQGKAGGWKEHFDDALREQAEQWIQIHLEDTDLTFPEHG